MNFLHQIKHTNNAYEKGIVVKETLEDAKQGYHAYLGAYAYGHDANTDMVQCMITNEGGAVLLNESWAQEVSPEPEPNAE